MISTSVLKFKSPGYLRPRYLVVISPCKDQLLVAIGEGSEVRKKVGKDAPGESNGDSYSRGSAELAGSLVGWQN